MSDFIVRRYKSSDKQKVKDLYKLASIHSEISYRDGPWRKDLEDVPAFYFNGGDFLVGLVNDEIVAMVGLQKITDSEGHIRRMRVHPEHRRKGYGLQILTELENRAKRNNFRELRLRTSTQLKMAQGLYEKNGFKKMKVKKSFYTEGGGKTFEVIWYRKQLE